MRGIARSLELPSVHPMLGARWRETDTRALLVPRSSYRIHYKIVGDTVYVVTIVRTRQMPPERL